MLFWFMKYYSSLVNVTKFYMLIVSLSFTSQKALSSVLFASCHFSPQHFTNQLSSIPFTSLKYISALFSSLEFSSVHFTSVKFICSIHFFSLQLNSFVEGSQRGNNSVLLWFCVLVMVPEFTFIQYFDWEKLPQPFTAHISSSPLWSSSSLSLSSLLTRS